MGLRLEEIWICCSFLLLSTVDCRDMSQATQHLPTRPERRNGIDAMD